MIETTHKIVELLEKQQNLKISLIPDLLEIPKRRIYDILAVMEGLNIIYRAKGNAYWITQEQGKHESKAIIIKTRGWFTQVQNKGRELYLESTEPNYEVTEITP